MTNVIPMPAAAGGFVYFVEAPDINRIKIGFSGAPISRVRDITNLSPIPAALMKVIDGDQREERRWHEDWASIRTHGEWFEGTPELRAAIAAAKPASAVGKHQLSVPLGPALREFVECEAARQHRTVASMIRHIIAEAARNEREHSSMSTA